MDELVDILDEKGNFTGKTALKSEAHKKGFFHPTVHIWCYTEKGTVLLQQRGKNKETFPLKWDVSVAGHVGAGESMVNGAIREVEEEIGVRINAEYLEQIGVFKSEKRHSETIFDREFNHTFLCLLDKDVVLTKQESEVEALQWLPISEFKNWVASENPDLVPNSGGRYQKVITAIEARIKNPKKYI